MQQVHETEDYSRFKFLKTNRAFSFREDLAVSISARGQLQPILVDNNMNIIDGQHRLEVLKTLGLPVKYIQNEKAISSDVVDINMLQVKWDNEDYLKRHVAAGNLHYSRFKEITDEYALPITGTLSMFTQKTSTNIGVLRSFRNGTLEVLGEPEILARQLLDKLQDIWEVSNGQFETKFKMTKFIRALVLIMRHMNYNHEFFLDKLSSSVLASQIKNPANIMDCTIVMQEIYNKNVRKENRIVIF